ncbi:hypothetical protein ElyMa_002706000 [Elysia marginata]|uniref:Uncharacterized protein n=1 Tax=Elysia marginata TaxID=1093978 RepID=A0AAV4HCC4_9GAST|nr:hypothetical protein ElyMa_002706000 [Elysia marginata]
MHSTARRCCKTNSDLPFERSDPGCWSQASCFTTTMRQSIRPGQRQTFWLATSGNCWSILAIHLTLPPVIFTYSLKMKEHLCGQRFKTEEDIIQATKEAIKNLDKCSYVTAFKDWLQRIGKCANNDGCYVK